MFIPLLLCWGSFLNVLAYRLTHPISLAYPWSVCPHCKKYIAWHDNIPLLSWLLLRGECRHCTQSISMLYPLIELLTVVVLSALFYLINPTYWPGYFLFFSALLVTVRTDLETMLISRFMTLFLIPVGFVLSASGWLPITLTQSIAGALLGYSVLFAAEKLFFLATKKHGIGEGDLELLAFIGAFTGIAGCWLSLLIGSLVGSVIGITYLVITKRKADFKIPFGPFLSAGAIVYVLFQQEILSLLLLV